MTITGTIEQAPNNAYLYTDTLSGDFVFRSITSNNFMFGFNSNRPSAFSVQPGGTFVNADPSTYQTANFYLNCTNASNTALTTNQTIGKINFAGNYGTSIVSACNVMASISTVYTGTGTTKGGAIVFSTDCNTGLTERLRITSGGNVGIGTFLPVSKLDVNGTTLLRAGNVNTGYNINQIQFGYSYTSSYLHAINTRHNSFGGVLNAIDFLLWDSNVSYSNVGTNVAMTITPAGVGIGSTTPGYKLDVAGNINATGCNNSNWTGAHVLQNTSTQSAPGILNLLAPNVSSNSSIASMIGQSVTSGNCMQTNFYYAGNANTSNSFGFSYYGGAGAFLNMTYAGNVGINKQAPAYPLDVGGNSRLGGSTVNIGSSNSAITLQLDDIATAKWQFTTTGYKLGFNNDVSGSFASKMVIQNNGNVGIGSSIPAYNLDVSGNTRLGGQQLYLGTSGTGNVFIDNSTTNGGQLIVGFNTGKPSAGQNVLQVYNNSADRNVIFSVSTAGTGSGNNGVGINTITPTEMLQVVGNVRYGAGGGDYYLRTAGQGHIWANDGGASSYIHMCYSVGSNGSSGDHIFYTKGDVNYGNGQERMRITSSGNVGIGLSTPSSTLQVVANTTSETQIIADFRHVNLTQGIGFGYDSINATGTNTNQDIHIYPKGSGCVGINTSSPAYTLDVGGTARVSSSITSPNITATSIMVSPTFQCSAGVMYINSEYQIHYTADYDGNNGGADHVFYAYNNERLRITSGGNVGINNSSPGYTLDVNGTFHTTGAHYINTAAWGDGIIFNNSTSHIWDQTSSPNGLVFHVDTTSNFTFMTTGGVSRMTIKGNTGNVGINNTNPQYTLDVGGSIHATGEIQSTSANNFRMVQGNYGTFWRNDGATTYLLSTNSGDQYGSWNGYRPFYYNNSSGQVTLANGAVVANDGGNVGIGNNNPQYKLDVSGSINVTGSLSATSTCFLGRNNGGGNGFGGSYIASGNTFDSTGSVHTINPLSSGSADNSAGICIITAKNAIYNYGTAKNGVLVISWVKIAGSANLQPVVIASNNYNMSVFGCSNNGANGIAIYTDSGMAITQTTIGGC